MHERLRLSTSEVLKVKRETGELSPSYPSFIPRNGVLADRSTQKRPYAFTYLAPKKMRVSHPQFVKQQVVSDNGLCFRLNSGMQRKCHDDANSEGFARELDR